MSNYYQLFHLQPTATPAEIQAAYHRERARVSSNESEELEQQLEALDKAYAVLYDPGQRAAYDRSLSNDLGNTAVMLVRPSDDAIVPSSVGASVLKRECWKCGGPNPIQAAMCAHCGIQLSRACPQCGQVVILNQTVCPRCSTFLSEYDARRSAEALTVEKNVMEERRDSQLRVTRLEAEHTVNRKAGATFWLVVFGLCIGLTVLAAFFFGFFEHVFR